MTIPQTQVTRYLQLINNRQFTEAHRQLQRIKQKTPKTEWNHGYYKALQGMLLAQKRNDNQYAFLQNLNLKDKTNLQRHKKEFLAHVQNRFNEDFDRGYFSAWHDYTRLLIKTIKEEIKSQPRLTDPTGQTIMTQYAQTKEPESR